MNRDRRMQAKRARRRRRQELARAARPAPSPVPIAPLEALPVNRAHARALLVRVKPPGVRGIARAFKGSPYRYTLRTLPPVRAKGTPQA